MRTLRLALAALTFVTACTPTEPPMPPSTPPSSQTNVSGPEAIARAIVDDLVAQRITAVSARFDEKMRAAVPDEKLAQVWGSVVTSGGAFAGIDSARVETQGSYQVVHLVTRFAKGRRAVKVTIGADDRVAGLLITPVKEDLEAAGRALVDALARGDFAAATANFDATMLNALPAAKLAAVWGQITAQAGAFGAIEGVEIKQDKGHLAAFVTCRFAKTKLVAKVIFDGEPRVAGLFFVPPEAAAPWSPPAYAHADHFVEREVQVGTAPALPGTLTLPKGAGPFPAVVLVHGSGPSDADETVGAAKVLKDLAWGLASRGIAVLRYVKRTRHAPAGVASVKEEVIDGARAAVDLCRTIPEIDPKRVVVAGHSQGAELAPRIAAESAGVAAIVMLAAPSRPLQDVLVDQFTYFLKLDPDNATLKQRVAEAHAFKKRVDDPGLKPEEKVPFPGGQPVLDGAYLLSLRGYDAAKVAAGLSIPILVLQGDRDYQVTTPDLDGYKHALAKKANATIKQYPALNHLFIAGQGTPSPAEYEKPGHVDEQVIADIAAFVGRLGAAPR